MAYNKIIFTQLLSAKCISILLLLLLPLALLAKPDQAAKAKGDQQKILLLDQYYRSGNYKFGLTRVKEFSRTFSKRYDEKSLYRVTLKSYAALFSIAISEVEDYYTYLGEAEKGFAQADKTDLSVYIISVGALAEAYANVGNQLKAEELYKELLNSEVYKREEKNNSYAADAAAGFAKTQFRQGYYNAAQKNIDQYMTRAFLRTGAYDSIPDKEGVLHYGKVKKKDLLLRKKQYATLALMKAEIFRENGYIDSALKVLNQSEVWIKKNLKYHEGLLAQAYLLKGQLYNVKDDLKEEEKALSKALGASQKFYKQYSPVAVEIQRELIRNLIEQGRPEEATVRNNNLDVQVLGYYGKNSLAYENNKLIDVEREIYNGEWKRAGRHLEDYLGNEGVLPPYHKNRADALIKIADAYINTNEIDKAEASMMKAVDIYEKLNGKKAPAYHLTMLKLAAFYTEYSDKFKEAENIYNTSFDSVLDVSISHYSVYYNQHKYGEAHLMEVLERYDKAEALYNDIVEDAKIKFGPTSIDYAIALDRHADFEVTIGNYLEADQKLKEARLIFEKNIQRRHIQDQAHLLQTLGRFLIVQGLYEEASTVFNKERRLLKRSFFEETDIYAAQEDVFLLNIYLGKYQKTEEALNDIIAMRQKRFGPEHKSLINPLCYLAYLKIVTGNYTEAETNVDKALAIAYKLFGENSIKYADVLVYKKMLYTAIGDYDQAEKAIKKVVDINVTHFGENHIKVAKYMHELALAKHYSQVDAKKTLVSNFSQEGDRGTTRSVGAVSTKKKEKTDAPKLNTSANSEVLFNKSLEILKEELGETNPEYAIALENAAVYYLNTGKVEVAVDYIKQAKSIWVKVLGDNNFYSARIDYLTGNILTVQGNYPEALKSYERSRNAFKDLFDENHPDYLEAQGKCAQVYYVLGDVKHAIESSEETVDKSLVYLTKIFPSLSERGKANYWVKVKGHFEFYNTLAFTQHEHHPNMVGKVYDITLKTKAILLSSSLKMKQRIQTSGDTVLIKNYEEWVDLKEDLGVAVSMSPAQRKADGIDIDKLELQIENYEKKLSKSSDLFAKNFATQKIEGWVSLKKVLNKNEIALEVVPFRVFDKKFNDTVIWYAVMAVSATTKKNPEFIVMKNGLRMNTRGISYYRNCIKYEIADERSYDMYWKDIKPLVKDDKMTVYFSGDGIYNQLNLETLKTPESSYLLTQNNIVLISSTRDLVESRMLKMKSKTKTAEDKKVDNMVLIGNPQYYAAATDTKTHHTVSQLPGAETEVLQVESNLKSANRHVITYIGAEATEGQLKKLFNPGVFHIATHGFFLQNEESDDEGLDDFSDKAVENPLLRSGLLLKNGGQLLQNEHVFAFNKEEGILTAYEAMNLNFDQTELVVLSACETGLGEVQLGEGVFGLQRSFLVAGSKSVVMSLFKVSDHVTAELMSSFYKKWMETSDKRGSFTAAKIEIMNKYNNPHFWGSFIMIGAN
ncbi:MAG: CHAT domain-containing protein [Cytophagaceae bacterium]|nr:CHAT domain-containing protein [Cytophagaceae bacterium]